MSIREKILSASNVETEASFIPEWGVKVYLRGMTGFEREQFETWLDQARKEGNLRARVAVMYCLDENGERIFQDSDVDTLNAKPVAPLSRIWDAMVRLSAISKEDVDTIEGN